MAPAHLLSLPDELLLHILSYLSALPYPHDIAVSTRVCKRLFPLAVGALYGRAHVRDDDDEKFTRAIALQPEHAKLVQELIIHYHEDKEVWQNNVGRKIDLAILLEELCPTLEKLENLRSLAIKGMHSEPDSTATFPEVFDGREEYDAWSTLFLRCAEPDSHILPNLTTCKPADLAGMPLLSFLRRRLPEVSRLCDLGL